MESKFYEEIKDNGGLVAIILREGYTSDKSKFFSPPHFPQQLGFLSLKKGDAIKTHLHKEVRREILATQEALFIKKGKIAVDFYTKEKKFIDSSELKEGDFIFLCSGGHGFRMLEDVEMIEVKQGPYPGRDIEKEIFE